VYLDEVYKGTSNSGGLLVLEQINPAQPHKLRVTKPGYTPQSDIPITTYSGQISVKLLPDVIQVRVTTDPPETEVYFDDVYKGVSTSEGVLIVDQVNPNQSHRLRGKKAGYVEQIRLLSSNSSEISLNLLPDPILLLIKDIRQQLAEGNLEKAFDGYNQLTIETPDNSELPRLLESILQALQARSVDMLKETGPFGLQIQISQAEKMQRLYSNARKWRPTDDVLETFGKYWEMKYAFLKIDQSSSAAEKETLRQTAKMILTDLGQRNLRNLFFHAEFGWGWVKLDDPSNAEKHFMTAQEIKPDWPYSYFANALLVLQAGEKLADKKVKLAKYTQAIEGFSKAISLKHDFSRAYAVRAIAHAYLKNYPAAADSGLQAITIEPNSAYAHFALGFAYFQKGGKTAYRSAKPEFERALSLAGTELDQGTKNSIQERLAKINKSIK
jgi:tetratricopeptide (TPR) repeat protein